MGIFKSGKKTIPVIRLEGVIGGSARGRNAALNLESLRESIDKAFAVKSAPFVGLAINSPGGSPVQSALIGNYIRQQAEKKSESKSMRFVKMWRHRAAIGWRQVPIKFM